MDEGSARKGSARKRSCKDLVAEQAVDEAKQSSASKVREKTDTLRGILHRVSAGIRTLLLFLSILSYFTPLSADTSDCHTPNTTGSPPMESIVFSVTKSTF